MKYRTQALVLPFVLGVLVSWGVVLWPQPRAKASAQRDASVLPRAALLEPTPVAPVAAAVVVPRSALRVAQPSVSTDLIDVPPPADPRELPRPGTLTTHAEPDENEAMLAEHTPRQLAWRTSFVNETEDPAWTASMQAQLDERAFALGGQGLRFDGLSCRQTICRVSLAFDSAETEATFRESLRDPELSYELRSFGSEGAPSLSYELMIQRE